ncbi:hypothetical protein Glove_74g170 [Diversispora epigaea]|uniref:Uncharacterized protein n=1 Tax=Diversispora epigaea TaxID=1348612 RepID=A0A397JFU4_9GLOM|nr:hypothetical protein Glove_74g170 [Diversispora epigaea]
MSSELELLRQRVVNLKSPISLALSVTPQASILSSINGHSDKDDIINSTKSLEDKEVDEFLNLKDKERNQKKTVNKIHDQNLNESSKSSINSDSTDPFEYNNNLSQPDKNQIVEQDLKQELSASPTFRKNITSNQNLLNGENQHNQVTAQSIVCIFRKAIQSGQEEILHWYDKRVNEIISNGKVKIKTAKSLVYKEVKQLLPDTTDVNLRQKTLRTKKIYNLFNAVGIEKIEQVMYSANVISNLTNTQIQNIINHVLSAELAQPKTMNKIHDRNNSKISIQTYDHAYFCNKLLEQYPNLYKEYSDGNDDYYGINAESLYPLCKLEHENEEGIEGLRLKKFTDVSIPQISIQTYDHAYFCNKLLEQYPNLYKEYSDGNDDYYGINAESLYPLCKLEHENEEGIEGKYKDRSYYIKCEVSEIGIVMSK